MKFAISRRGRQGEAEVDERCEKRGVSVYEVS